MEPDLDRVVCQDHAHCATCGQLVLGWDCWRDAAGNYFCTAECWLEHPDNENEGTGFGGRDYD